MNYRPSNFIEKTWANIVFFAEQMPMRISLKQGKKFHQNS